MRHRPIRLAIASTAAAGLIAGGIASAAVAAPHGQHAARAAVPTFKAAIKHNKLSVKGPKSVPSGTVKVSYRSVGSEYELDIVSFKHNYSMQHFKKDLAAFGKSMNQQGQPSKAGLRHLRNAIRHTFSYGGFDAAPGSPESGTFLLNRPGTVYMYNDSNGLPVQVHKITVTHAKGVQQLPRTKAHVTMQDNRRFGGSKKLPATGTITVTNKATESPHFLSLQHVKEGTTRKQVEQYLQSGSDAPPSWALQGNGGTDLLTTHESQTLTYSLPKGEYVEMCFFPDPKTGMPHALMGMIGIVHLK